VIADQLMERFVASGLMLKEWDRVKLHATVMNTLFRKDPSGAYPSSLLINTFKVVPLNGKYFCWLLCFVFLNFVVFLNLKNTYKVVGRCH